MPVEVAAYRWALRALAKVIRVEMLDPTSLARDDAVLEAEELCQVYSFLARRRSVLRKSLCPTANFDWRTCTPAAEAADLADAALVDEGVRIGAQADDPRHWSVRDSPDAGTFITDAVCHLHHLADAIGSDWDDVVGAADAYYQEEAAEPSAPAEGQ